MASTAITFTETNGEHVCSLTISKATKIHIEKPSGRTSFHVKLAEGTRYAEIKGAASDQDTICVTIEDRVYPFDLQIRCDEKPSLAYKLEEAE